MAITTAAETKKFVLKAYKTETDARADTNALLLSAPASSTGSILNNPSQSATYHYFAFQRYYYRIEANEPVSEFHIDWDDGENNSPSKANVSIIKTDRPEFYAITSHIYTQSKKFYPLIRVKSKEGFLSKWYTAHAGSGTGTAIGTNNLNDVSGLDAQFKNKTTSGLLQDQGQNNFSILSVEKNNNTTTAYARIPVFEPANVPPVGVLKVDRKRVFSGIDNDRLGDNSRMLNESSAELPHTQTVHAFCSNAARSGIQVKVTYQEGILGGEAEKWSIKTAAKGSGAENNEFTQNDLESDVITIYTMDETYMLWVNLNNTQSISQPPSQYNPSLHVPIIATPDVTDTQGGLAICTSEKLASAIHSALTGVIYPASGGRTEFTSEWTDAGAGNQQLITVTHNRTGKPYEAGFAATINQVGVNNAFLDTDANNGGHGVAGVLQINAGVDASDGTIKQKTLTTESAYHANSRIVNVSKILRVELVNNLENADSYGGSTGLTTLSPGERVYLLSSIHTSSATTAPTGLMRNNNPNLSNTLATVSLGNPIMDLNSLGTRLMADATESKIRCSNKSATYYYIDDNKLMSGDTDANTARHQLDNWNAGEGSGTASAGNVTERLVPGADFRSTSGTKELRYSLDWWRDHQDNNNRFYSQKRLIRCQIQDNHTQILDDSYNASPIIHFNSERYLPIGVQAANQQPSEVEQWNYGAMTFTNLARLRSPEWDGKQSDNADDRIPILGCFTSPDASMLRASSAFDTATTADHYQPDNFGNASAQTYVDTVGPNNALFMAHKVKFDRVFFRVNHDRYNAASVHATQAPDLQDILNNPTMGSNGWSKMRVQALYPAKKTKNSSTIIWKPLSIIDRTKLKGKDDSSLYRSGEIIFTPPSDWEKTSHSGANPGSNDTNIIYPFEDNFFEDGATDGNGLNDLWTNDSYAILLLITNIQSTPDGHERLKSVFNVMHAYPFSNAHSQLVEIVDPMHVSLNSYGIAQSVSFVRKGNYQEIKDKSGITQMRRIGATGGQIKLGSLDLKNDVKTTRVKFQEFQKDAVPVYYDVVHKDDSRTRLFGIITDMSEDYPTAILTPKFSTSMTVTHILEIDSSGNISGDGYTPLGGDVIDVEQYLSAS